MVRESIFDATWKAIRDGKFALMSPVITSTDGRCVASDEMDADRARLLRDARHRGLDLLGRHHHEVGELVDDDDDVGQLPAAGGSAAAWRCGLGRRDLVAHFVA